MSTVQLEETLHQALKETDLLAFQHVLVVEKQLTKVEHFDHVTDDELRSYGLSAPAVRRLRTALDRRKKAKKSKLFSSKPKPTRFINVVCEPPSSQSATNTAAGAKNEPSTSSASSAPCLIARDDVQLSEKIGEGTFATVKRGVWQRSGSLIKTECAVKILHQMSEQAVEDLHAEIAHMQKLRHQNVVQLHGIVLGEPTMMVIEYCDGGSLLNRLRNTKKPVLLVTKLLSYGVQIASGMAYLESRRCVHRDLACRNVLLAENEDVIKICDFGLTRTLDENARMYEMSGQKRVPFAWCPPESLRFRQFSHKSDVWAFGVTLWELYTYGEEPWVGHRAADVLRVTEAGEQLQKPRKCLKEVYAIMQMCWNLEADLRPRFSQLRNLLLDIRFMTAETREAYISEEPDTLELSKGDHVVIISECDQKEWFGQCVGTRKFGRFPYSLVSVKSHRVSNAAPPKNGNVASPSALAAASSFPMNSQGYISRPVAGSLIHAGHGDIDEAKCWGHVDRIDEIYLKNPVVRPPSSAGDARPRGVSFISSATALHDEFPSGSTANNKVRPVSSVKLDFDPLKAWDMPSAPVITPTVREKQPAAMTKSTPKPPISVNKPAVPTKSAAFDSVRSEYERLKAERLKNAQQQQSQAIKPPPAATLKYSASTAVPRPQSTLTTQRSFESAVQSARSAASFSNLNEFAARPVQPAAVLTPIPTIPMATTSAPATQRNGTVDPLENDPFFVDPNVKSLSLRSQPPLQHAAIPWRTAPPAVQPAVQPLPVASLQRPQSARLPDMKSAQKPPELDQSLLALLDPLMSAKVQQQQQPAKITRTVQPAASVQQTVVPAQPTSARVETTAIPRGQAVFSRNSTTPSALNVLAFVSNNQKANPPPPSALNPPASISKQEVQHKPPPTTQPTTSSAPWTYVPPSALPSAPKTPAEMPRPAPAPAQPTTSVLPPPSALVFSAPAPSAVPPTTGTNGRAATSFLPPPSKLLLDGFKKETPAISKQTADSAYGSLNSNSSVTKLTFNSTSLLDSLNTSNGFTPQPIQQQVYNVQRSSFNPPALDFSTPQSNYFSFQPPTSAPSNGPTFHSNIPFLTPTPLEKKPPAAQPKQPTAVISLNDLDFDQMVANVRQATFAPDDQCTKALKASDYKVDEAIRFLKVEKLLELGFCSNRSAAVQALTKSNWDVNEAVLQFLS